jgi:colicin import membrane protein
MGRETNISYERVAAAADSIQAAGGKPTSRAIRERLGNTGSMGTINKLLQEWKSVQDRHQTHTLSLPPVLQRTILDFMGQELAGAKAILEDALAEQKQEAADLAAENERQAADIEDRNEMEAALRAELATLQGRIVQAESGLTAARNETARERDLVSAAQIELAKALLRLEALPRLDTDLASLRIALENERQGRMSAAQQAAVLEAKLEAADERATKAEAEAEKRRDAIALETSRADALQNTVANLNGKVEAMQTQIQQQVRELEAARQQTKKAGGAGERGKRQP